MTTAIMLVEAGLGVAVLPTYIWSFARSREGGLEGRWSSRRSERKVIVDSLGQPFAVAGGRRLHAAFCESMRVPRCRARCAARCKLRPARRR